MVITVSGQHTQAETRNCYNDYVLWTSLSDVLRTEMNSTMTLRTILLLGVKTQTSEIY